MAKKALSPPLAPIVPDRPHMPEAVVSWLEAQLRRSRCFLEFGSGGSTRLAASLNVPEIVTIESDPTFMDAVRAALEKDQTASNCALIYADVGQTQQWGYPLNFAGFRRWPNYALGAWDYLRENRLSPDLILIDGRFRVGCFLVSLLDARPGTKILFDDYDDRKEVYGSVEKFVTPTRLLDRSAVFTVPEKLPRQAVARALARYISIPD